MYVCVGRVKNQQNVSPPHPPHPQIAVNTPTLQYWELPPLKKPGHLIEAAHTCTHTLPPK